MFSRDSRDALLALAAVSVIAGVCSLAFAKPSPQIKGVLRSVEPALAPYALEREFRNIGIRPGAERTFPEGTFRLESFRVFGDGEWIVVRVLPKRVGQ